MKLPPRVVGLILMLAAALSGSDALAQTKDEVIRSLSGTTTRGSLAPANDETAERTRSLVESLQGKPTRQITVEERTELAEITRDNDLPRIDLEVYFAYDSAAIEQAALPTLITLGQALADKKLKDAVFLIAGHTDAAGGAPYNQVLSERRAEAVKSLMVDTFKLNPKTLIAIGYGEEQLKLSHAPLAGENRRVQVVNLTGS